MLLASLDQKPTKTLQHNVMQVVCKGMRLLHLLLALISGSNQMSFKTRSVEWSKIE